MWPSGNKICSDWLVLESVMEWNDGVNQFLARAQVVLEQGLCSAPSPPSVVTHNEPSQAYQSAQAPSHVLWS